MSRFLFAAGVAAGVAAASAAAAAGPSGAEIFENGAPSGAPACAACHGADGHGSDDGQFPAIAGLDAAYLAKQIADFKAGRRVNDTMAPIAEMLTDAEVAAVTAQIAAMAPAGPTGEGSKAGAAIATLGRWDLGVPACESCHGAGGVGAGPHFPALAGQKAAYVVAQFGEWRSGKRKGDPLGLMKSVADRLDDADLAAVAAHFQAARR